MPSECMYQKKTELLRSLFPKTLRSLMRLMKPTATMIRWLSGKPLLLIGCSSGFSLIALSHVHLASQENRAQEAIIDAEDAELVE
jgi:hypothetical protein